MFTFPYDYIMFVNALLILLFVVVLYRGYKEGMLLQVVNLINTFVAVVIAWLFADVFAEIYQFVHYNKTGYISLDNFFTSNANKLIWFFVLFVVIRLLLMVLKPIASGISKMPLIKQVNSLAGGLFSIVTFVVYLVLITIFLTLPIIENGAEVIEGSYLGTVNRILEPALSGLEKTIQKNESIQYILSEKELTLSQKQSIVDMLTENGFSNDEIREFLSKYHD